MIKEAMGKRTNVCLLSQVVELPPARRSQANQHYESAVQTGENGGGKQRERERRIEERERVRGNRERGVGRDV